MTFGGTFFLLDPSFKGANGGSMTFGGGVATAAERNGVKMKMAVSQEIPATEAAFYNAVPIFAAATELAKIRFQATTVDTSAFFSAYSKDLSCFETQLCCQDVLWDYYLLGPMQVDAYSKWLDQMPVDKRPRVMVGVDVYDTRWHKWLSPISERLRSLESCLRLTTTSFTHKKTIEAQLGVQVQLMPRPLMARKTQAFPLDQSMVALLAGRSGKNGPLVGFFTDASVMKSFHLLGDVVTRMIEASDINFAIQVRAEPVEGACTASLAKLRLLAARHPNRVTLLGGALEHKAYKSAVELCDGIIIAYDPASHFSDTPSGTMCEALAAGTIPLVIEGTSMAKELGIFDINIPVVARQDVASFESLLLDFADNSKNWMNQNRAAIQEWNAFQSYENLFEHVFEKAWS